MGDTSHLDAIYLRLSHERERVRMAKTERERTWREHNVRMIEREREGEVAFLAKQGVVIAEPAKMTLNEILAELEQIAPDPDILREDRDERRRIEREDRP